MSRFNTQYDRVTPFTYERNIAPSETLPDETLTIPEILSKYIRGQRVDGSFPSGFETPEEGVDGTFDELYNDSQEFVESQVQNQVQNQVDNQVQNQVDNQVQNQVQNQVDNQVQNQVQNQA